MKPGSRRYRYRRQLAVVPALLLLAPMPTQAGLGPVESPETPWEIVADSITYEKQPASVVAAGAVVIRQQQEGEAEPLVIMADWVHYEPDLHRAEAKGKVVITAGPDEIRAEAASIQLDSRTGTFEQATLFRAENNLHLSGYTIEKTGERTYHLRTSQLTTCPLTPAAAPPWSIGSGDTRVTAGGYAHLWHATFRIRDYPLIYFPYLIVPANQERKTGLLFPEYSQSRRDGTGIIAPLFINLSPSRDLTLYPGWLSQRGGLVGLELRYMSDIRSRGTLAANFLHDRTADTPEDDYKSDGLLRTEHNRYWLRGKVDHEFDDHLVGRLDLDLVSDRDYLQEFQEGLTGFRKSNEAFLSQFHRGLQAETSPERENTLQLARRSASSEVAAELLAVDDARDEPGAEKPLYSLPRLLFNGVTPLAWVPADLSWESEYINYWRRQGLGAHRLDLHPRLLAALPTGPYLETALAAGPRETIYLAEVYGSEPEAGRTLGEHAEHRTLFDLEAKTATTLIREFSLLAGDSSRTELLRHTVRPEIGYSYTPDIDQTDLPALDAEDRVGPKNWLTYGVNNYFFRHSLRDGASAGRDLGYLKVTQAYDHGEELHPFSDLAFDMLMTPVKQLSLRYETTISMYGQGVTHYYLRTSWSGSRPDDRLSLGYRYLQHAGLTKPFFYTESPAGSVHELNAALATRLTDKLSASYDVTNSFATSKVVSSSLHLLYRPSCWSVEMVAAKLPDDFTVFLVFSLEGIGKALELGLPGMGK